MLESVPGTVQTCNPLRHAAPYNSIFDFSFQEPILRAQDLHIILQLTEDPAIALQKLEKVWLTASC